MLIHSLQYSPETGPESRINGTELSATAEQVAERNGNARKNLAYCYGSKKHTRTCHEVSRTTQTHSDTTQTHARAELAAEARQSKNV
jgi:hypothetical protein